jgi:hypothetical protein
VVTAVRGWDWEGGGASGVFWRVSASIVMDIRPRLGTMYSSVKFEVSTAVTMKNGVFWDIKPSSYFTGDTLRLCYRVQPVNAM